MSNKMDVFVLANQQLMGRKINDNSIGQGFRQILCTDENMSNRGNANETCPRAVSINHQVNLSIKVSAMISYFYQI